MLVVLDNCEHVTAALAPFADQLLQSRPALRLLATSRQPLGIAGEVIERIAGLPLSPDTEPGTSGDGGAVQLYVDRAEALAHPPVLDDPVQRGIVTDLCRRLDGLPLAIELAAAQADVLSPRQLHARLHRRFELHAPKAPSLTRGTGVSKQHSTGATTPSTPSIGPCSTGSACSAGRSPSTPSSASRATKSCPATR